MKLPKKELRKIYLERRKKLSEKEVALKSDRIVRNIIRYFDWSEIQNIHTFLPIKSQKEVDIWGFIRWIFVEKKDKTIFIPKIMGEEIQSFVLREDIILKENKWGILEPEGNNFVSTTHYDMVLTPLLYSDNQGNRVGYGKGFYDNFFAKINSNAIKVGVGFFSPKQMVSDISEQDIPLDYLVTPDEVLSFSSLKSKSIK